MNNPNDFPSKDVWTDKILDEINYLALEWVVPITGNTTTQYEIHAVNHLKNFGWSVILHLQRRGLIKIE